MNFVDFSTKYPSEWGVIKMEIYKGIRMLYNQCALQTV